MDKTEREVKAGRKNEKLARSTAPGFSFSSRRQNKEIVLLGLLLDEQRRTNELLEAMTQRASL